MATLLKSRVEPLQFDLAQLEKDPNAIVGYHQKIQRRIVSLLPPLGETLRLTEGVRLNARLREREAALGIATLPSSSLLLLTQLMHEEGLDMAQHLFGPHLATLLAWEKQALLPGDAHVQKTVSLLIGGQLVLVTSIGDRLLGLPERFALAAKLGLSRSAARKATINPPGCVAEQEFGLLRGMVNPFLPTCFGKGLRVIAHIPWPQVWEEEDQRVAISLSPCESLLIPLRCYRHILHRYVRWSIPNVPLIELDAEGQMRFPPGREGGVRNHVGPL
jgi:hypothetical protein